jgi:signal transduction histidine kinase
LAGRSHHSARSLLSLLESALPIGVARVRGDGVLVEESEGFADLLAGTSRSLADRVAAEQRERLAEALAAVADGAPERTLEVRSGNGRPERLLELLVRRAGDLEDPLAVVVRDGSESALLQRRLAQSERVRLVGEMVLGCAHELGNLLGVAAALTADADGGDDDDRGLLRRAIHDAVALVQRLQRFARGEEPDPSPVPVDVRGILADALEFTRLRWQRRAATEGIRVEVSAQLLPTGTVLGSPVQLRHAVANLITNALDAMPRGGTLRATCRREGDEALLEIADTGTGIAPELMERVFQPFFSTKDESGLGLGLSIVSDVVARHRGRLEAVSHPETGTVFTLRLPLVASIAARAPGDTHPSVATGPARILVVEDEPNLRRLVARTLRSDGHEVVECGSAEDAAGLPAEGAAFDLLLLDVSLPGRSGLDLIPTLRANGHRAPVLLMTAWGLDVAAVDVARVLTKPFGTEALRRAVAELRQRGA